MKLSDQLAEVGKLKSYKQCTVGVFLSSLEKGEAETVTVLLMDPERAAAQLANVLKAAGHQISAEVLRRHRRRECKCQ